jgi:hypothetical protein
MLPCRGAGCGGAGCGHLREHVEQQRQHEGVPRGRDDDRHDAGQQLARDARVTARRAARQKLFRTARVCAPPRCPWRQQRRQLRRRPPCQSCIPDPLRLHLDARAAIRAHKQAIALSRTHDAARGAARARGPTCRTTASRACWSRACRRTPRCAGWSARLRARHAPLGRAACPAWAAVGGPGARGWPPDVAVAFP